MAQPWRFVSHDTREHYIWLTLSHYFHSNFPETLIYNWTRWDRSLRCGLPEGIRRVRASRTICNGHQPMLSLPPEVLLRIFDFSKMSSAIRLLVTCTMLWHIGWVHFEQRLRTKLSRGPWAGSQVCIRGQYRNIEGESGEEETKLLESCQRRSWSGICCDSPEEHDLWYTTTSHWISPNELPLREAQIVDQFLRNPWSIVTTETWTLRNLTAKEYVHATSLHAAFQKGPCPFGPYVGYPGFGYAILSRICYSVHPSGGLFNGMHNGPWVYHRFEICPQSIHNQLSDTTWTDVSEGIIRDLRHIVRVCGSALPT